MSARRGGHRDLLHQLAERYGIETGVRAARVKDATHQQRSMPIATIIAALRALGVQLESPEDIAPAIREHRAREWTSICNPAAAVWDGAGEVEVRLPSRHPTNEVAMTLVREDREELTETIPVRGYKVVGAARPDDRTSYLARPVPLPWTLPPGYHRLNLDAGDVSGSMLLISAPRRAYTHPVTRSWGAFLPLYALSSEESWGAGSFSDLRRMLDWTVERGGSYAGTLPLLPAFLDEPFEPSPYSPVSRLFWNEFYIDVNAVPELEASQAARELLASSAFQTELAALRAEELVDYRRGMALRRQALELLAGTLAESEGARRQEFEEWVEQRPRVRDYARFRAVCERQASGFPGWPEELQAGGITEDDYDPAVAHYHAYVQWIAESQLADCAAAGGSEARGLYLDLPLGVHGGGYDVWSEPRAFVPGFSVGAPPDALGAEGQNWGFPPLHPLRLREDGYGYFIDVIRHHMRHAALLRVDHIMGLHRQYWIPDGVENAEGVYVRYPADELYAILCLESHRSRTELVGEDLGTVPDYVRPRLADHQISRMLIVPFEIEEPETALGTVEDPALAALNTHDMPPFAGVWESWFDDEAREKLVTLLVEEGRLAGPSDDLSTSLKADLEAIVPAVLEQLGASEARTVMVNLEDLWLETRLQNVPGTTDEQHPNWRRRARHTFEDFATLPSVVDTLGRLDPQRRRHVPSAVEGTRDEAEQP